MQRGNFFPLDELNIASISSRNYYDIYAQPLDRLVDPSYDDPLYGFYQHPVYTNETGQAVSRYTESNHYFGMTCELRFIMSENGFNKGIPMTYDFESDDDLWVYVDGEKLLESVVSMTAFRAKSTSLRVRSPMEPRRRLLRR